MAVGLVQYVLMRGSTLKGIGAAAPDPLPRRQRLRYLVGGIVVVVLIVVAFVTGLVPLESLANIVTGVAAIGAVDEVCLTTSPMLTGTTLPSLGAAAFSPIALRPALLMTDEHGALYSRWFAIRD